MLNPSLQSVQLLENEYKLYSRQITLNKIGLEGQKRLKSAKILLIGAGALATPAIIYLAKSGIGNIGIIDRDIVKLSNLPRQILYNYNHIEKPKVNIIQNIIFQANPACKVTIYNENLSEFNSLKIIKRYDIVIDSCDNFQTRYIIDSACFNLHKVHIYGAIQGFTGQVSVFNYKNGPRYKDLYPRKLDLDNNQCNSMGVIGITPGTIGILQATEVVKIILGLGKVLSGYLLIYNLLELSFKLVRLDKILNINQKSYTELITNENNYISLNNFKKLAKNNKKKPLIIDVRQSNEFHRKHIHKAINIPLENLKLYPAIEFIKKSSTRKKIIIYCNSNSRSITASKILKSQEIKYNILNHKL